MIQRYQIDDLVTQDQRGVVFHGVDLETNSPVAMRRFLPADGGDSGGLDASKSNAYQDAVATMRTVSHPSLRAVLDGGCDPVDGMPYLVTQWSDGTSLREWILANGQPTPEFARFVLARMLDVCLSLSKVFGREELWIETTLESVVISPPATAGAPPANVSFWVCPWRWFGGKTCGDWRERVAEFAETILGGHVLATLDPKNATLMVWVQRIRHGELTSLQAALGALKAPPSIIESTPPPSASPRLVVEKRPAPAFATNAANLNVRLPSANPNTGSTWKIITAVCALALICGGAWWAANQKDPQQPQPAAITPTTSPTPRAIPTTPPPPSPGQARVDSMIQEIRNDADAANQRRTSVESRGYYTTRETDLLLGRSGYEVKFRGRLERVRFSGSGLTMYLEFSKDPQPTEPRAYAMKRDLVDGIHPDDLEPYIGKFIEIRGTLDVENIAGTRRPRVNLSGPDRIVVLPDEEDVDLQ